MKTFKEYIAEGGDTKTIKELLNLKDELYDNAFFNPKADKNGGTVVNIENNNRVLTKAESDKIYKFVKKNEEKILKNSIRGKYIEINQVS